MSDTLTIWLVFVLSFVVFLIVISFALARSPLKERVTKISNREKTKKPSGPKRPYSFLIEVIKRLSPIGSPKEEMELSRTQLRLMRAGYRGSNAHIIFYGTKVFLAILFAATFLVSRTYWVQLPYTRSMFLLLLFTAAGLYLPDLWIYLRAGKRREKIREGFPDALDLLVICVEAGQGLDAAINRVGEEIWVTNKVLSDEFKFLTLEIRAGKRRRDALKNLALRANIEEISSFIVLINQTEQFGVSIAQALRVHSDSMRTRRRQKAEELAGKIPVKLTIPLILFILPTLFVVLMAPAMINAVRIIIRHGILR